MHFVISGLVRLLLLMLFVSLPSCQSSQASSTESDVVKSKVQDAQNETPQVESKPDAADDDEAQQDNEDEDQADRDDDKQEDEDKDADDDDEENGDEAGDDDDADEKEEEANDDTITLSGYFAAEKHEEVALRPDSWSTFSVVEAVPHGTVVKKGEVLVAFDARKLDEAIADLEAEVGTSQMSLVEAEHKFELLKKTTPIRMANAERAERIATEDLKRYLTIKRDSRVKSIDQSVKNASNWLMYQEEELEQLEKMYEADDLTEETEEIILLRTRNDVENARFSLERVHESHDETLDVDLPRRHETLEEALRKTNLALEEARLTLPAKLESEKLSLANKHMQHERLTERLERLQADRELMELEAPISGTVYFGRSKHGKWSEPSTLAEILRPGGNVKPHRILMSVVKLELVQIAASIEEKNLRYLLPGTSGTVKPTAYPDNEFAATIDSVAAIPSGEKFPALLNIDELPDEITLVPGMTCKIEFTKPESESEDDDSSDED